MQSQAAHPAYEALALALGAESRARAEVDEARRALEAVGDPDAEFLAAEAECQRLIRLRDETLAEIEAKLGPALALRNKHQRTRNDKRLARSRALERLKDAERAHAAATAAAETAIAAQSTVGAPVGV